jgi:hypothetical protein
MNKRQNRTYRFETLHHGRDSVLSLLPLNMMLTHAQKDLPARVVSQSEDASDELVLKLIRNVKTQFKRSHPAHCIGSSLRLEMKETVEPDV